VTDEVNIRRVEPGDTGRVRALRLEMLADTPLAFLTTLAQAAAQPHDQVAGRVARASAGRQVGQFIAESARRMIGQVVAMGSDTDPDVTMLFAIYVTPTFRGGPILAGLVEAAAAWSRECGRARLELEVVTTNVRAERAYRKLGFDLVGGPVPHPTIATMTEQVMARAA
jgi:GNAT superfamily N-acetyltransferase